MSNLAATLEQLQCNDEADALRTREAALRAKVKAIRERDFLERVNAVIANVQAMGTDSSSGAPEEATPEIHDTLGLAETSVEMGDMEDALERWQNVLSEGCSAAQSGRCQGSCRIFIG